MTINEKLDNSQVFYRVLRSLKLNIIKYYSFLSAPFFFFVCSLQLYYPQSSRVLIKNKKDQTKILLLLISVHIAYNTKINQAPI